MSATNAGQEQKGQGRGSQNARGTTGTDGAQRLISAAYFVFEGEPPVLKSGDRGFIAGRQLLAVLAEFKAESGIQSVPGTQGTTQAHADRALVRELDRAACYLLLALGEAKLIPHDFAVDSAVSNLRTAITAVREGARR